MKCRNAPPLARLRLPLDDLLLNLPDEIKAEIATSQITKSALVEIDQALKNADMDLIPHPFLGNDLTGKTVVLVDPMSKFIERAARIQESGDSVLDLFHRGKIKLDNVEMPRGRPSGVSVFKAKIK